MLVTPQTRLFSGITVPFADTEKLILVASRALVVSDFADLRLHQKSLGKLSKIV